LCDGIIVKFEHWLLPIFMNIRHTHFIIRLLFVGLFFHLTACDLINQDKSSAPNILIILADDMGYSDLGFFGSEIHTPNLDRLAGNGLVMTNFYNTSRCCPSRASLLTGLYQHQTGIGFMSGNMGYPSYQGFLNDSCVTIAELLGDAGYRTYLSGKWHVGDQPGQWPLDRGFQRFFGFPKGGGVYFYPFRKDRNAVLDSTIVEVDSATFYSTDAFTDYAIQFLESDKEAESPFFLYLPYIAPHFPLQAWPDDIQKYRGRYMEGFSAIRAARYEKLKANKIIPENFKLSPVDDEVINWETLTDAEKEDYDLRMAVYAAMVDRMDQNIGKLISKLEELDVLENTVILFLSDNGASPEDPAWNNPNDGEPGTRYSFTGYRRSWANVSNTPFRMYKHWVHEGGISTPLIVHYPEGIPTHRIEEQKGHILDIMPTCLELAGVRYPANYKAVPIKAMEGKSLVPVFKDSIREDYPAMFWEHHGNRAVRHQQWKLVSKYPENQWELYDMSVDRTELIDLANEYPEKVDELEKMYKKWANRVGVVPWAQLTSGY